MSKVLKHTEILDGIYQIVNEHLISHFIALLKHAPDLLNKQAENSMNHNEQEKYFSLYRFIKNNSDAMNQAFFISLNEHLTTTPQKNNNSDELSLVSEDEMEELVIITTMHAHAMNLYGEQIDHLEARLEYMAITSENEIDKEGLTPERIGKAFQSMLQSFSLELSDRLELFQIFESKIILNLEPMYQDINELLIRSGIMPEIVLKTSRNLEDDEPEANIKQVKYSQPNKGPGQPGTGQSSRSGGISNEFGDMASRYMSSEYVAPQSASHLPESFRRPVSQKESNGKQYYARKDVLKALSRLQNSIINNGDTAEQHNIESIKRSLFTNMAEQEGGVANKQVNTLDERSIDFVGMMFDAITQDANIAVVIKNLLLRLQIPVIKVAMSDDRLFQNKKHPARETLDLITEAGKGVNEEADRLFSELENVVDAILEEYDIDIESFEKAADELRQLIDAEQRATQEYEAREQRAIVFSNAREVIVDEVKHITTQKRIPQNVMPLITKNWPSLMINRYVKHGKESWQWLESVMLMKLLIKCLQPIQNSAQWQTVWNNHLALLDAVKDELDTTQQDKKQIEKQLGNLKDTFLEILDTYGFKLVEDVRVSSATMFDDADPDKDAEIAAQQLHAANDDVIYEDDATLRSTHIASIAEEARKKLNKLPSDVHPGVWFEIFNGEDKAIRRLKLSVVLTEVAKLVFVDRKGIKVIEKDAADFATELDNKKSRFIADHSTFDHALGRVIHSLAA